MYRNSLFIYLSFSSKRPWTALIGFMCVIFFKPDILPADSPDSVSHPYPNAEEAEIWVLNGQSNMQGSSPIPPGVTPEELAPDPRIMMFNLDNTWMPAEEPLHRHYEAVAPIYRKLYQKTPEEWAQLAGESRKGKAPHFGQVGPGLFFAKHLAESIDKPIGLIPCAFGGLPIERWDPALKDQGGESLYGAMLERIKMVGGKIRGVIWYQGESDALDPARAAVYEEKFLGFVDGLRRDTGIDDLTVIYVQLARFAIFESGREPAQSLEKVREAQRLAASKRKNLFMVSAIDLPLYDHAHLAYAGQKRLGRRLAEIALSKVYGQEGHATPIHLKSVEPVTFDVPLDANPSLKHGLRVRFSGINGRFISPDRPTGFEVRYLPDSKQTPPIVYRVEFESSGCLLRLNKPITEPASLYYGGGQMPFVNITDERDIPIPAFGPVEVQGH